MFGEKIHSYTLKWFLERIFFLEGETYYLTAIQYQRKQTKNSSSNKLPPSALVQQCPCTPVWLAALWGPLLPTSGLQSQAHSWKRFTVEYEGAKHRNRAAYVLSTPAPVMKCSAIHSINRIRLKSITFRFVVHCELQVVFFFVVFLNALLISHWLSWTLSNKHKQQQMYLPYNYKSPDLTCKLTILQMRQF